MDLPPPDPNEASAPEPDGRTMVNGPTAVFRIPPSREDERLATAILRARPGLLFVSRQR